MRKKPRYIVIFTLSLIISYIFLAIVLWLTGIYLEGAPIQKSLKKYVQGHNQELHKVVFNSLFTKAQFCSQQSPESIQKQCQKEVTYTLSQTIIEEELTTPEGYSWPNDLFFIKQSQNKLYLLGWEGKLEDITKTSSPPTPIPYLIRVLTNQCKPFKAEPTFLPDCQTYESLDLGNGEKGFVVRRIGVTEEGDFLFVLLMPILATLGTVGSIVTGNFVNFSYYAWVPLLGTIIPFAIATTVTAVYIKKTTNKPPKNETQ